MRLIFDKVQRRIAALEDQKQDLEQIASELHRDSRMIEEFLVGKNGFMTLDMPALAESDGDYSRLSAAGVESIVDQSGQNPDRAADTDKN